MEIFNSAWTSLGMVDTGVFSGPDPVRPLVTTFGDYRTLEINSVNNDIKYMKLTQVIWGDAWDDLEFKSGEAPIPEPATMLLLGSGLIGLAGYGRKKFFKK